MLQKNSDETLQSELWLCFLANPRLDRSSHQLPEAIVRIRLDFTCSSTAPRCCKRNRGETLQTGFGGQDRSVFSFACSSTTGEVKNVRTWAAKATAGASDSGFGRFLLQQRGTGKAQNAPVLSNLRLAHKTNPKPD